MGWESIMTQSYPKKVKTKTKSPSIRGGCLLTIRGSLFFSSNLGWGGLKTPAAWWHCYMESNFNLQIDLSFEALKELVGNNIVPVISNQNSKESSLGG